MIDYEPIDLSIYCNAGVELYDPTNYTSGGTYLEPRPSKPPFDAQIFHGIPFQIGAPGNDGRCCLLGFGGQPDLYHQPLTIPLNHNQAYHILVAHALLETNLWRGGPLGVEIARYVLHYDTGESVSCAIRERFEIGNFPTPWGQYPFLCLPDQNDYLEDRRQGQWSKIGFRLTEIGWGRPQGYYLWAWSNPCPDLKLKSLEIIPNGQKFVLAAITLSHLPEYPFIRRPRRPVKITLLEAQRTEEKFNLEIEVDRGVAAYAYPLPIAPLNDLPEEMAGYGAPFNERGNPVYSEIAAIPSATVKVNNNDMPIYSASWGKVEAEGQDGDDKVRIELVDPGRNWVKVEVRDLDTGQKIPCRIAFLSPDGIPYPPHGHHAPIFSNLDTWNGDIGGDVRLGQIAYAYIDGSCEGWLPRGKVWVDAARGFEYQPVRQWVDILPGQRELTIYMKRWIDMNALGYFSGDTHVHFLSSQGAQLEAQGEDLNVVNLLLSQWGHLFTNTEDFIGRPHVSPDGRTVVYASQENRQHILGHLSLLGLKRPVMPWASGGPNEAELGGSLEITLSHWADAARAQGATVILPHMPTPNAEAAVLIATHRVDAVEMLDFLSYEHREYYRYLNAGYRLPLVGGTDKMDAAVPVGLYRTYVYLPPEQGFSYDNWRKALRSGHTFLSGGPLIWFSIEGKPVGSTLKVKPGSKVELLAEVRSIFPVHTLQIVQEGSVVAEVSEPKGSRELRLHERINISSDTWLAARCAGPNYTALPHFDVRRRSIMAHTSPIYLTTGSEYSLHNLETVQYMLTLISGGLEYIRNLSLLHQDSHATHHHGLENHLEYLERPFHQAGEILHRQLHTHRIRR